MAKQILIDESLAGYIIEQMNQQREDLILQREALDEEIAELDGKIKSILQQVQEENSKKETKDATIQNILQRTEEFRQQNPVRPQALSPAAVQQPKQTTKVLGDLMRLRTDDLVSILKRHGIKSTAQIVEILCLEREIKIPSENHTRLSKNCSFLISTAVKNRKIQSVYDKDSKKFIYSV